MANKTPPAPEVVALGQDIFRHQLRLKKVMAEAGLAASTWTRWAAGADPKASNLAAVRSAITRLTQTEIGD